MAGWNVGKSKKSKKSKSCKNLNARNRQNRAISNRKEMVASSRMALGPNQHSRRRREDNPDPPARHRLAPHGMP